MVEIAPDAVGFGFDLRIGGKRVFPAPNELPLAEISKVGPENSDVRSFLVSDIQGDQRIVLVLEDDDSQLVAASDKYLCVTQTEKHMCIGITPSGEDADELVLPRSKAEFPPDWSRLFSSG